MPKKREDDRKEENKKSRVQLAQDRLRVKRIRNNIERGLRRGAPAHRANPDDWVVFDHEAGDISLGDWSRYGGGTGLVVADDTTDHDDDPDDRAGDKDDDTIDSDPSTRDVTPSIPDSNDQEPLGPSAISEIKDSISDFVTPQEEEVLEALQIPFNHSCLADPSKKQAHTPPVVTVFGAGIAGLTAAHELVERGFIVQVVEDKRRFDSEDECEVGGLAASQFGRVKETRKLHPYLFDDNDRSYPEVFEWDRCVNWEKASGGHYWSSLIDSTRSKIDTSKWVNAKDRPASESKVKKALKKRLLEARNQPFQRVQSQFDFSGHVNFTKNDDCSISDFSKSNIQYVAVELLKAFARYRQDLEYEVVRTVSKKEVEDSEGSPLKAAQKVIKELDDEFVIRESILLEVRGHTRRDASEPLDLGRQRAMAVKATIVDVIDYLLTYAKGKLERKSHTSFQGKRKKSQVPVDNFRLAIKEFDEAFPASVSDAGDPPLPIERLLEELKTSDDADRTLKQSIENYIIVVTAGDSQPVGNPAYEKDRLRSDRVQFHVIEHIIPGEHGFRFFPAFYRHLFDTMRRTPLLNKDGSATHRNAFDQLVESPDSAVGLTEGNERPKTFSRGPVKSLAELRERANYMRDKLGITNRDFLRASTQVVKFLTSSNRRRELYEEMSFLSFIDGDSELNPKIFDNFLNPGKKTDYSDAAENLILELPQLLVAMSAEESDAHTNMAVSAQLMLGASGQDEQKDLILNGPTSTAWLRPWKDYLSSQGVRFYTGYLKKFRWNSDKEIVPVARSDKLNQASGTIDSKQNPTPEPNGPIYQNESDFYVLALPLQRVVPLVRQLTKKDRIPEEDVKRFRGDLRTLLTYCDRYGLQAADPKSAEPGRDAVYEDRDELGKPNNPMNFPFRDLVGIQYYFRHHFQFEQSHVNYLQTPWNLSSISQAFHWLQKPSQTIGFLGQLSVDVGDMYQPTEVPQWFSRKLMPKSAWESDSTQIARATWTQIMGSAGRDYETMPPTYFHLDRGLSFNPEHGFVEAKVQQNNTPLLINLPRQWSYRPGLKKASNGGQRKIEYKLTTNRWVMAGNFMATHTRLTTMESACESARHAVNAILDTLHTTLVPELYNSAGRRLGDDCAIWNPADNELADLDYLKEIDAGLVEDGQPHLFDLLGLLSAVDKMPKENKQHGLRWALEKAIAHHKGMAEDLGGGPSGSMPAALSGLSVDGFEQLLRNVKSLQELINGTKPGGRID